MHRVVIIFVLALMSTSLWAITPEELARLSEKGASDKRKVDRQLNLNDLHYKLRVNEVESSGDVQAINKDKTSPSSLRLVHKQEVKEAIVSAEADQKKQQSIKYSNNKKQVGYPQPNHPQNFRNARRKEERSSHSGSQQNPSTYTTANVSSQYETYSDAVEPDKKKFFGIRRGTWIKAELRRDINNAEPGDVELYLSQEIYGLKNTLSVDTQLFANKGLNTATKRLDMLTTYAITPSGHEFVLKARIYDMSKVSGLVGIIDIDDSKIAMSGATAGLASFGNGVLKEFGGGSVVGNALSKGGQSIINDQRDISSLEADQNVTIYVAPQAVLLRVEETF